MNSMIWQWLEQNWNLWLVLGLFGQSLFMMRFIAQWLASEKAGRSVVPVAFWYYSIAGGAITFIYACYRADPVFIIGQGSGLLIYLRNLQLVLRERKNSG
jgi:lipid-A-disaccharide synthase-like uncharacterized protein